MLTLEKKNPVLVIYGIIFQKIDIISDVIISKAAVLEEKFLLLSL